MTKGIQPENRNYLAGNGFSFSIKKIPNIIYFSHSVVLPGLVLESADVSTPFSDVPLPGDKLFYNELTLDFKVDEDLENWKEIFNWMVGLGTPESWSQYKTLKDLDDVNNQTEITSDATLTILTSHSNANIEITFIDCWPSNLTDLTLDFKTADIEYLDATVTFKYHHYKFA
jgi:hypothetical protein